MPEASRVAALSDEPVSAKEPTARPARQWRWPLTRILPLGVAIAMFAVALLTTQVGLRLLESREFQALASKAEIFLNALADMTADRLAGGSDSVAAHLAEKRFLSVALAEELLVLRWTGTGDDPAGGTVALGDQALDYPPLEQLLAQAETDRPGVLTFMLDRDKALALAAKSFQLSDQVLTIAAVLDTSGVHAAARRAERWALLVDLLLAALAAAATYALIRRAIAPFHGLALELGRLDGAPTLGAARRWGAELDRLEQAIQARLDAEMARDVAIRDIGEKDRNALLAKLAAGLAHEVRNPLAGLLNAVSTLRRFGQDPKVRDETLDLIERGLRSIGRVADSMLATYRPAAGRAVFTSVDLDDLQLLIMPEARRRQVSVNWQAAPFASVAVDADALRQILLNLLLNALKASTAGGEIAFAVDQTGTESSFIIADSGPGMPDSVLAFLVDGARLAPVMDNKGLGLWLVTRLLEDIGGRIKVESRSGRGTSVVVRIDTAAKVEP